MSDPSGTAVEAREAGNVEASEGTRPGPVFAPPVDIFETTEVITVLADIPGVTADNLTIDLDDNVLTIVGRCEDSYGEGETEIVREYERGTFRRRFTLSELVDQEGIDATVSDGVLRLTLPKIDRAKPTKIEVKARK